MKRALRIGPLIFRDPILLCGVLYVLLWFDASGFLRLGLCAAFLHEWGHILVYWAMFRTFPTIEVTLTGFCMRTRGRSMTPQQTFWLAAAGPLTNVLLAALWAVRLEQEATIRGNRVLGGQSPDRGIQPPAHPAAGWGADGPCPPGGAAAAKSRIAIPPEIG